MGRKKWLALVLVMSLFFPVLVFAETVLLKSGKTIEGKITEKTDLYIKVDIAGVAVPYFLDDIESIDGEKLVAQIKKVESLPVDSKEQGSLESKGVSPVRALPFLTATITYKISGGINSGKEIVYIDPVNNRIARDIQVITKENGETSKYNMRQVASGKTMYVIDFDKKTATTFDLRGGDIISEVFQEKTFSQYYKGKRLILGKECEGYQTPVEELCFWNGIALKEEFVHHPMGDKFNMIKEAISIKLDTPIPEDIFTIPNDIKVLDAAQTQDYLQNMSKTEEDNNLAKDKDANKEELSVIIEEMKKLRGK